MAKDIVADDPYETSPWWEGFWTKVLSGKQGYKELDFDYLEEWVYGRLLILGVGITTEPDRLKPFCESIDVSDFSETVVKHHADKGYFAFRFDVLRDTLEGKWDCIFCNNLLEHFSNPQEIVDKVLPHCKRFIALCPYQRCYNDPSHKTRLHEGSFDVVNYVSRVGPKQKQILFVWENDDKERDETWV